MQRGVIGGDVEVAEAAVGIGNRAAEDGDDVVHRDGLELENLRARDERRVDVKVRIVGGGANEADDAALYWLAKMLHAGEDPRFISRRLVISASEDIGLADSNALRVAMDAHSAFEFIGMPEGRIPLAHATVYLATAPKSNTAYAALGKAMDDVENGRTLAVPVHLRTGTRKKLAAASGEPAASMNYLYAHDFEGAYIPQAYLPEGKVYYYPGDQGMEKRIKERLDYWRSQIEAAGA